MREVIKQKEQVPIRRDRSGMLQSNPMTLLSEEDDDDCCVFIDLTCNLLGNILI